MSCLSRKLIILALCLSLFSCSSIIVIKELDKEGRVVRIYEATDYNFKTAQVTATPDRWLTKETAASIMTNSNNLIELLMEILKRIPAIAP
jgi:hypothetical protein